MPAAAVVIRGRNSTCGSPSYSRGRQAVMVGIEAPVDTAAVLATRATAEDIPLPAIPVVVVPTPEEAAIQEAGIARSASRLM